MSTVKRIGSDAAFQTNACMGDSLFVNCENLMDCCERGTDLISRNFLARQAIMAKTEII